MQLNIALSVALLATIPAEAYKYPEVQFANSNTYIEAFVKIPVKNFFSSGGIQSVRWLLQDSEFPRIGFMVDWVRLNFGKPGTTCVLEVPPQKGAEPFYDQRNGITNPNETSFFTLSDYTPLHFLRIGGLPANLTDAVIVCAVEKPKKHSKKLSLWGKKVQPIKEQ
ncbi:unnamed protein product [Diplocarpon coronariae]